MEQIFAIGPSFHEAGSPLTDLPQNARQLVDVIGL
jgi:hypothetical protein